jgi:hypothetical protein
MWIQVAIGENWVHLEMEAAGAPNLDEIRPGAWYAQRPSYQRDSWQ